MTYDNMKDSGVPWIGEIPTDWKISRIKDKFSLRNERNYEPLEDVNLISLYTDKGVVQHSDLTETTGNRAATADGYKKVRRNDIVVNIILCWMGAVGMSDYDGVTSPAYDVYQPKGETFSKYYHYLFRTSRFNGECFRYGRGIMLMRWRTYSDEFTAIKIPAPPPDIQRKIAEFLDAQCAKIDAIIEESKASVDDYKRWKTSVIYQAVTKGLDPDAPMKNSGVSWVGKIPFGWKCHKIKRLFSVIGSGSTPVSSESAYYDGEIPWLQSGDIGESEVFTTSKSVSRIALEDISALKIYKAPFIAIAMYGASIANASIVCIDACTNQACCVLSQPKADVYFKFVYYAVLASKEELLLSARGGTQPNISQDIMKQLKIPVPPFEEQKQIASFLDSKISEINSVISEKQSLIAELEAYKKSLIYEAVTGKRKVG